MYTLPLSEPLHGSGEPDNSDNNDNSMIMIIVIIVIIVMIVMIVMIMIIVKIVMISFCMKREDLVYLWSAADSRRPG